jgi:hypothetical protein
MKKPVGITSLLAPVEQAEEFTTGYRSVMDTVQLREHKKQLIKDGITFVEGTDSIYMLSSRVKIINRDTAVYWPTLDGKVVLMTPGEVARTELRREFGDYKRFYKKADFDREKKLLDTPPPYFWDGIPVKNKPLFYVDLSAAYWQIYQWLTLDMVHPLGMGDKHFYHLAHRLKEFKLARNSIIGITRTCKMSVWKKGEPIEQGFTNPYYNPAIWATVQGIMHELAWTARTHGAAYIAVDGYIFCSPLDFGWFTAFLDDMGFTYKTEKGEGYILGWSVYSVGNKATRGRSKGLLPGPDTVQFKKGYLEWFQKIKKRYRSRLTIEGQ